MFNLQGSEIVIVLLLALVVLGPEKLPDAMRKMGQAYGELRKMSSGFQSEFRAAVDEPLREVRETANMLRDSADFTKLQDGKRQEKPKSGEMAPADPDAVPTDDAPTFETGPAVAAESKPAPFADEGSETPGVPPADVTIDSDSDSGTDADRPAGDAPPDGDGGSPDDEADTTR